jgi:hypothetical protein
MEAVANYERCSPTTANSESKPMMLILFSIIDVEIGDS